MTHNQLLSSTCANKFRISDNFYRAVPVATPNLTSQCWVCFLFGRMLQELHTSYHQLWSIASYKLYRIWNILHRIDTHIRLRVSYQHQVTWPSATDITLSNLSWCYHLGYNLRINALSAQVLQATHNRLLLHTSTNFFRVSIILYQAVWVATTTQSWV